MKRCFLSICLSVSIVTGHAVQAESALQFEQPALPLSKALEQFAKQAHISLAYPPLSYRDGKAQALHGSYESLSAALDALLADTGYDYDIISEKAVRIKRQRIKQPPAPLQENMNIQHNNPPIIEEIIVTSTKRQDYASKLPYGISVHRGVMLDALSGANTRDVIATMPGVVSTQMGTGRNKLIVRGISDGAFSGRTQALVSTYLDYSRMIYNAPEPAFKLVDIESIEMLRGPQGTLYGSGSLSGLYRIITRKPEMNEYSLSLSAGGSHMASSGFSENLAATFNMPLLHDKIAIRGNIYQDWNAGYIDDQRLNKKNVNATRLSGGRLALKWYLSDYTNLTFGLNSQRHAADDSGYFVKELEPYQRANYLPEPRDDTLFQAYGRLNTQTHDLELVSNLSLMTRDIDSLYDATLSTLKYGNGSAQPSPYTDDRHIRSITSETHLRSPSGGRFEWITGIFLSQQREYQSNDLKMPNAPALLGPDDKAIIYQEKMVENIGEYAIFGEISWYLTEHLALTGGLRGFLYNDKAETEFNDLGTAPILDASGDQHKKGLVPKAAITWHISDDTMAYSQFSEGYRLGGINLKGPSIAGEDDHESDINPAQDEDLTALTSYRSDRLKSFEMGLKKFLWGGQIRFNFTGYLTKWNNIQSDQYTAQGLPTVGNVGNGNIHGAEVQITARPSSNLILEGNIGFNRSELTSINPEFGATMGAAYEGRLPGAPALTAGLALHYELSLGAGIDGSFNALYHYIGASDLLFIEQQNYRSDPLHKTQTSLNFGRDGWSIQLYADNLLNSKANSFAFGNPFLLGNVNLITPMRPRSFGLRFQYHY